MKIRGTPPRLGVNSSRGVHSVRYLSHGRVVVAKWPRGRGKKVPAINAAQVRLWDMAQELAKSPEPLAALFANKLTNGTAFYPRDILLMASYGNYVSWPGNGWYYTDA